MLHWKDYEIDKAEREYDRQEKAERLERERAEEEAACAAVAAVEAAEEAAALPRIERRPVRLVRTAQGDLFAPRIVSIGPGLFVRSAAPRRKGGR